MDEMTASDPPTVQPTLVTTDRPDQFRTLRAAWLWVVVGPLLAVVTVFVLTYYDPFEFESATKRQSANIFYKMYGALYPTRNRDKIAVILIDDETIRANTESWPPSHKLHGEVLSAILSYNPLAVLVDIYFIQGRAGDHFDRTEVAIENYNVKKIPLFLVAARPSRAAPESARRELRWLAQEKKVTLVSADVDNEVGEPPLYPFASKTMNKPAAVAIYETICHLEEAKKPAGIDCSGVDKHGLDEFEVVWGLVPARYNCQRARNTPSIKHVCDDLFSSLHGRAYQLATESSTPRNFRHFDPLPISYHAVISADDILDGTKRDELKTLLTGKIVIYGAHLALVKDEVYSPVHGSTDGVFVHAMALDNLLTFGSGVIHRGAGHRRFHKEWTEFQPAVLMILVGFGIALNRWRLLRKFPPEEWDHRVKERDDACLLKVGWGLVIVVTILGLVEFAYGISPFNWLALIIVVHIAHTIERRFFNPAKWRRILGTRV
jgi:CHASE2 domain-containing sensor protein